MTKNPAGNRDPYARLLHDAPAPPDGMAGLLKQLWDAYRAEDWILNGTVPDGCSAPGEHLTEIGRDAGGRWARHDGETLRAADAEWLRHTTEVSAISRMWWRTAWEPWPKRQRPAAGGADEIRLVLNCGDEPAPSFNLYACLSRDDGLPNGRPALRTYQEDADREMLTDAGIEVDVNPTVGELLEWLLWLPFDGRRRTA